MIINNLPKKYQVLWNKCLPLLREGRPGDVDHAAEVVNFILHYTGKIKFDKSILIPVAIMHDIGHAAILPEHFKYITGPHKISNGKLVHMLAGAKIAKGILEKIKYNKKQAQEIVDIISIHDFDRLQDIDIKKIYNTKNKKIFHDIDALDRYTQKRLKNISVMYKDRDKLLQLLEKFLDLFFYQEFKTIAKKGLKDLKEHGAK